MLDGNWLWFMKLAVTFYHLPMLQSYEFFAELCKRVNKMSGRGVREMCLINLMFNAMKIVC